MRFGQVQRFDCALVNSGCQFVMSLRHDLWAVENGREPVSIFGFRLDRQTSGRSVSIHLAHKTEMAVVPEFTTTTCDLPWRCAVALSATRFPGKAMFIDSQFQAPEMASAFGIFKVAIASPIKIPNANSLLNFIFISKLTVK